MAALTAALAVAAGCSNAPTAADWRRDIAAARARWTATGIADYTFSVARSCNCSASVRPITVTVVAGAFSSGVYADNTGGAVDTTQYRDFLTVDRLFTYMEQLVDGGPFAFNAEYSSSGIPTSVVVNPQRLVSGEEYSFGVYEFSRSTR